MLLVKSQLKGKKHIEYIRLMAISIWRETGYTEGQFPASLLIALKRHRDEQSEFARKETAKYPNCIVCKNRLNQGDIYHFTCYCYECWKNKRVNMAAIYNN